MQKMDVNLSAFVTEKDISQEQKFQILHDVVQGLNHLHTMSPPIIHGDLHGKNVLINSRGKAKIADYGNRCVNIQPELVTLTHETVDFMSPESQEDSSYVYNDKHDVFSYGHLSIYVINQSRPHPLLWPTYKDSEKRLTARTEVERRMRFLNGVKTQLDGGDEHPFYSIIVASLADEADSRPSCADILQSGVFTAILDKSSETDFLSSDTLVQATGILLGHGAFADVIEVEYGGKTYAAKKYHHAGVDVSSEEHDIVCKIRHPNIVPYYGICKLAGDNATVLIMERLQIDLGAFLEKNADVALEQKFNILFNVIKGLHYLHSQQPAIVHGDLTVTNVLLDLNGVAKVCDFGNSSFVDLRKTDEPLAFKLGTLDYMPPEGIESGHYNDKLDVFSYAHLSIYVIVHHRPQPLLRPFYIEHGTPIARSEVERRRQYLDEVTSVLDGGDQHLFYSIIIRCLHDEAAMRPSCADILESGTFDTCVQKI
jgi:serine/threonine protein kinase